MNIDRAIAKKQAEIDAIGYYDWARRRQLCMALDTFKWKHGRSPYNPSKPINQNNHPERAQA